jgi:hypothetical protein
MRPPTSRLRAIGRRVESRLAAFAWLMLSPLLVILASSCGDDPSTPTNSNSSATTPKPAQSTSASTAADSSHATKGVWYLAPRADDPQFPVVEGRDGTDAKFILELTGSGVGMIDYDRDGDLDLYVVMGRRYGDPNDATSDRLLKNDGLGHFEDVTDAAKVRESGFGMGCAVGDYDCDGFDDLFVSNWGCDRLMRNRGDGTFEDVTTKTGVSDDGWSTSCAFGDPDGDGDLDLYVCRYFVHDEKHPPNDGKPCPFLDLLVPCGPQWLPAERDLYWRNDLVKVGKDGTREVGEAKFTEVSAQVGMQNVRPSYGLGVTFCDADGDGKLDVFVGNDSLPRFLFHNRGDGTFEEQGALTGLAANIDGHEQASMGIDVADWNGDGREDFVVTNFSNDYNTVYRNEGDGFFTDVTQAVGLGDVAWWTLGWGTRFLDADCDGDLDLFVANGHVYPGIDGHGSMTYAELNHLYLQENGRFGLVSKEAGPGMQLVKPSRGAAVGDLNGDGWLDVVVVERNQPLSILRSVPQAGVHRAMVELVPGADHRPVDHSVVTAKVGERSMLRRVNRGGSYCSSNDPRVHFGLGKAAKIDELTVRWPDGTTSVFRDVPGDTLVRVTRGAASSTGGGASIGAPASLNTQPLRDGAPP